MVDTDALIDSKLAHVIAIFLGIVGIVSVVAGGTASEFWFWIFYGVAWILFFNLFDDDEAFWRIFSGETEEQKETEPEPPEEDPVTILQRRYANDEIDEEEFDARLDRVLDSPGSVRELEQA